MKKTKILVATLTAATLAIGCGAFAACGETEEPVTYEITFDANGGTYANDAATTKLKTDENGKIAQKPTDPTREEWTFVSYTTTKNDESTKITLGVNGYQFKKDTTVYALWAEDTPVVTEYTVTLELHGGSLEEGASTSLTTVNGKLAELPTPAAASEELAFKGWYTAAENGDEITTETVFEADTVIHAQWRDADGIYSPDGTFLAPLEYGEAGTFARQLSGYVELDAGDAVILKVDGVALAHTPGTGTGGLYTDSGCHGITFNQSEATFTANGTYGYTIYAKNWVNSETDYGWTIYMDDGVKEVLVDGGLYLVGENFANAGWSANAACYIDPVNGLTVTFTTDSAFKVSTYSEAENKLNWDFNGAENYVLEEGTTEDDIALPGSANGKALTAGTYKFTLGEDGKCHIEKVVEEA